MGGLMIQMGLYLLFQYQFLTSVVLGFVLFDEKTLQFFLLSETKIETVHVFSLFPSLLTFLFGTDGHLLVS